MTSPETPFDPLSSIEPGDSAFEAMPTEELRRAASLTLRSDEIREQRLVSMEAANKSLADALRLTYRALQIVMIALVALFALSGFEQVNQAESGIRVDLGRIKSEQLEPGFQFAPPYPFGQIVKVPTGTRTLELEDAFWPEMTADERRRPLDEITPRGALKPGGDGSLLTAGNNIAHAQFTIVYSIEDPVAYLRTITVPTGRGAAPSGSFEAALVRSAVRRAAVRVAAESEIDDILKRGSSDSDSGRRENSIESRIRQIAQQTLEQVGGGQGVGIEISQVLMRRTTPPFSVRRDFNQVQIAQSSAGKVRDEALGQSSSTLNAIAGSAHVPLIDLIDRYERAIQLSDDEQARVLLQTILDVLDGAYDTRPDRPSVEIAGRTFDDLRLSGEASEIISSANRYRQTAARSAQRRAETFLAKRAQFLANPSVFAMAEWSNAYTRFLSRPNTELFWVPDGTKNLEILITSDPEIAREQESKRYEEDVRGNLRLRGLEGTNR